MSAADRAEEIFWAVHSGLPREGPGNEASTLRALSATGISGAARVLDVGCGPGLQTLQLARALPEAEITAVDLHKPFLEDLRQRAAAAGLDHRVHVEPGDMRSLTFAPGTFDLLWSEGAIYNMGVRAALDAWRPLLADGGAVAFTDAVWLKPDPPEALVRWWQEGYAAMGSLAECLKVVEAAGCSVLEHFVLPESAWWDDYYTPLENRLTELRESFADDLAALAALAPHQLEVDYYRRWSAFYGYLFVIARPTG
ncbi:MAG: class I SAM-dependent methyltransferase [Pseudomonadota bacterium]